jgi:hypothetical protein
MISAIITNAGSQFSIPKCMAGIHILAPTDAAKVVHWLQPNVIFLLANDGSGRLLNLNGNFYALSTSGARILKELLERSPEEATDHLAFRYGVDAEQVKLDLER